MTVRNARKLPIATRNGEPAWKNAPERKRQSHVTRNVEPLEQPRKRGALLRLLGRG